MTVTLILTMIGALLYNTAFVVFICMHIKRQQNPSHPSPPALWLVIAFLSLLLGFGATVKIVELTYTTRR